MLLLVSTNENNKITHEKKLGTHEIPMKARWHDAAKPTRPTIARDPPNLAHSFKNRYLDAFRAFLKQGEGDTTESL